jgi:hypothetical protein
LDVFTGNTQNIDQLPVPDLIIVDLCDDETVRALPGLCAQSDVPLVGLNATAPTMMVLSGKSHKVNSVQELMTLLLDVIRESSKTEDF